MIPNEEEQKAKNVQDALAKMAGEAPIEIPQDRFVDPHDLSVFKQARLIAEAAQAKAESANKTVEILTLKVQMKYGLAPSDQLDLESGRIIPHK